MEKLLIGVHEINGVRMYPLGVFFCADCFFEYPGEVFRFAMKNIEACFMFLACLCVYLQKKEYGFYKEQTNHS